MSLTMHFKKAVIALAVGLLCLVAIPSSAYAASIDNTIATSKDSLAVNQSMTLTCTTTYAMLGVGPLGAPFMSDWLTEVPYTYYAKPTVTSYTGSTNGSWSRATGIRSTSTVWQQKTSPEWFYGETTWRGTYTVKAILASSSTKLAHGQTTNINSSEGPTAYKYVQITS